MKLNMTNFLVACAVVLILASMSIFIVDQRQTAIVFQLGEVMRVETTPGIKLKMPLVQNVRFFDSRILTLDSVDPERFITAEKKNVLVDSFVKWRIIDVKQYYISVGGDEARAQTRLTQTVNSTLREEFGKRTIHEVVSGQRDELMHVVQEKTDIDARKIGVEVLDVRLKRVDFPWRSAIRCIAVWMPSVSALPTNCVRQVTPKAKRSAPMRIASVK
jgi:modulator of FtsH protease HflC